MNIRNGRDRYFRQTANPVSGKEEREWIRYADDTFEPVRKAGNIKRKWRSGRDDDRWWVVKKPAKWHPEDDGSRFAWNHAFGEEGKPTDWGGKTEHEIRADGSPYYARIELDENNRIVRRVERIDGRRETWDFTYDEEGRLTCCQSDTGWCREFEYDSQGRRSKDYEVGRKPLARSYAYGKDNRLLSAGDSRYEHDHSGFRSAMTVGDQVTRYEYSPDYLLLGVAMPDGRSIRYEHDNAGMVRTKFIDGQVVERYEWLDFIRLKRFEGWGNSWEFHYDDYDRIPLTATVNNMEYNLCFDQVGTLKCMVEVNTGHVVKALQIGPFGGVVLDSRPGLRVPLGFAGGLYDPDTGFVRFGWRDYDPATGRWTAPDPLGDAAGDPDWYGYCLDDPVNFIDPLGLLGWGFGSDGHDFPGGLGPSPGSPGGDGNDNDNDGDSWVKDLKKWAKKYDFRKNPDQPKPEPKSLYRQIQEQRAAEAAEQAAAEAADRKRRDNLMAERQAEKEKTIDRIMSRMGRKKGMLAQTVDDVTASKAMPGTMEAAKAAPSVGTPDAVPERKEAEPASTGPVSKSLSKEVEQKAKKSSKPDLSSFRDMARRQERAMRRRGMTVDRGLPQGLDEDTGDTVDVSYSEWGGDYSGPSKVNPNAFRDMWSGIRKALKKGFFGAGKGFAEVGKAFANNDDFRNWTLTALGAGASSVALGLSMPEIAAVSIPAAPMAYQGSVAAENVIDAVTPGPPSTPTGTATGLYEHMREK